MNFLVVGPGAMGCLFAARLKNAGCEVALLDYRADRAEIINSRGILVEGITGEYNVRVPVITGRPNEIPDVVLICVKAGQTEEVAQRIKPWFGKNSWVLTLQNGLGNIEILQGILGKDRVLGGVTAEGGTLLGPGHLRHAGKGETAVGPEGLSGSPLDVLISCLNKAGFTAKPVKDVESLIWGKLLINVGINALTAITGLKNGKLAEVDGTIEIMRSAVMEAFEVARARRISLPYSDPVQRVTEVCRATAGNIASMLQDVLNRRTTEVAFINGAIVREGERLGIPTPVNRTLGLLVNAIQETYGDRVRG